MGIIFDTNFIQKEYTSLFNLVNIDDTNYNDQNEIDIEGKNNTESIVKKSGIKYLNHDDDMF